MVTTAAASSLPTTRSSSPTPPTNRFSTPPPPPPAGAVPTDFRSSLAAWWNNTSYKEARIAEERLLRRMAHFQPPPPVEEGRGWFGRAATAAPTPHPEMHQEAPASAADVTSAHQRQGEEVSQPIPIEGTKLVATLRNVFISTPNPLAAPQHPADPIIVEHDSPAGSASSSQASLDKTCKDKVKSAGRRKAGKTEDYLNTLEISRPEDRGEKEAVVVLHGYAAALGFFFRNWDAISQHAASTSRRTFFLDWLGMGLSSRPAPALLSSPSGTPIPARVARAEHFFLSSLESWREAAGIERMILVGHSLGGYLASAYAVRYPHRVSGLILVSPAGIPHGKEYTRYETTAEAERQRALGGGVAGVEKGTGKKVDEDTIQGGSLDEAAAAADAELGGGDAAAAEAKGEAKEWNKNQTLLRKNMMKFFTWGWEKGISPFTFLRTMGPFGPMFAGRYSLRRFAAQSDEDVRDLHGYIYNTSVLKGSGEFCISHILAPGAYARVPIVDRIGGLKVPVTFLYGDNDWMDVQGGHDSAVELKKAGNDNCAVHVVKDAGHHVYLDNPEDTNRIIGEAIRAIPKTL